MPPVHKAHEAVLALLELQVLLEDKATQVRQVDRAQPVRQAEQVLPAHQDRAVQTGGTVTLGQQELQDRRGKTVSLVVREEQALLVAVAALVEPGQLVLLEMTAILDVLAARGQAVSRGKTAHQAAAAILELQEE